jgi:8-oxo-dGTP pyrophosphatase MutT (NUDIX family)
MGEGHKQAEIFVQTLERALAGTLPGRTAQFTLAPSVRRSIEEIDVRGKACREGSVLVLLYPDTTNEPHLVLTVRHSNLAVHAGQVSFPGGRREPNESLSEAALREAYEELGIDPTTLRLLGPLTPIYIPPSNFCVYPHVAWATTRPCFNLQAAEVDALLEVPLSHLVAPGQPGQETREIEGQLVEIPFFLVGTHRVWGATAMIIAELLAVVASLPDLQGNSA